MKKYPRNFNKTQNNTSSKGNTAVKLNYLQIKHPQSIFSGFLTLVLNSKTERLDLVSAGRLFHTSKANNI